MPRRKPLQWIHPPLKALPANAPESRYDEAIDLFLISRAIRIASRVPNAKQARRIAIGFKKRLEARGYQGRVESHYDTRTGTLFFYRPEFGGVSQLPVLTKAVSGGVLKRGVARQIIMRREDVVLEFWARIEKTRMRQRLYKAAERLKTKIIVISLGPRHLAVLFPRSGLAPGGSARGEPHHEPDQKT